MIKYYYKPDNAFKKDPISPSQRKGARGWILHYVHGAHVHAGGNSLVEREFVVGGH